MKTFSSLGALAFVLLSPVFISTSLADDASNQSVFIKDVKQIKLSSPNVDNNSHSTKLDNNKQDDLLLPKLDKDEEARKEADEKKKQLEQQQKEKEQQEKAQQEKAQAQKEQAQKDQEQAEQKERTLAQQPTQKTITNPAPAQKTITEVSDTSSPQGAFNALANEYHLSDSDKDKWGFIISKESGWNPQAQNPSGAFGLGQALPAGKISPYGDINSPTAQLKWMYSYMNSRYGGISGAYAFWISHNWY